MRRPSAPPRRPSSSAPKPAPSVPAEYISGRQVARRLQCNPRHVAELVRRGMIGVRQLPGVAQSRYCRADVERVAATAFIPARVDQQLEASSPPPSQPGRSARRRG
jgi:hypothetical protein